MSVRRRRLALGLLGLLLVTVGAHAGHPRRRWRRYGYPPPYAYRYGPYWGYGIDHPWYQPWIPLPEPRRNDPRGRYERWMDEGFQAFRRGELTVARHRFEEARDLASERWGPESRQARRAREALGNLARPGSPAPEPVRGGAATPGAPLSEAEVPALEESGGAARGEATTSPDAALPPASPAVRSTLERIRARLEVARRARQR